MLPSQSSLACYYLRVPRLGQCQCVSRIVAKGKTLSGPHVAGAASRSPKIYMLYMSMQFGEPEILITSAHGLSLVRSAGKAGSSASSRCISGWKQPDSEI